MWTVEFNVFGNVESCQVDATTLEEALTKAVVELGFDGNDEGVYTIKASAD